jgi:phosphoglycerate dehydrogenase-like enzyme
MKVVLQYRASAGFRRQIAALAHFEVAVIDETDKAGFDAAMAEAEVLWHVLKPVTAAVIAAAPRLRLIQKLGVGVNTIDLEAARAAGVAVANMPGTNSAAVAEMALALMLAALRRLLDFDQLTRRGDGWRPDAAILDSVGEIGGRVVGLVGFGDSARRLAPVLAALGARVVYTARAAKPDVAFEFLAMDELLAIADIVSLHAPLTAATTHLIDAAALARMKPGAILINTARGGLVDEAALVAALRSGRLRAAGLDVFDPEPPAPDNPLFALPQVVLSPHLAWLTPETLARSLAVAVENVRRLESGDPLLHRVV